MSLFVRLLYYCQRINNKPAYNYNTNINEQQQEIGKRTISRHPA